MLIINKHFNFCCFRALTYTTLDRLCAVFLYNLCRFYTRSSPYVVLHVVTSHHVWLYIKHMVIHIYLYSNIPLYRMRLYTWLCITIYSYTRNFVHIYVYTRHIHVCHRSIHSLSIPTSSFMSRHRLFKVR